MTTLPRRSVLTMLALTPTLGTLRKTPANGADLLDPLNHGVTFDGTTDDTAAWQTWLTHIRQALPTTNTGPEHGATIPFPRGTSLNSLPLDLPYAVTITGHGQGTELVATDAGPFFTLTGRNQHLHRLTITAIGPGARCVDLPRFARGTLRDLILTQHNPDQPAIRHHYTDPAAGGIFHTIVDGVQVHHANNQTVPSIEITTKAGVSAMNENRWSGLFLFTGDNTSAPTAPAVAISSANARNRGNDLWLSGEFTAAGLLHCAGLAASTIRASIFDTPNTVTDHMIALSDSLNGKWGCRAVRIERYHRAAGALNPGIADIWQGTKAGGLVVDNLGERPNTTHVIDANHQPATIGGLLTDPGGPLDWELRNMPPGSPVTAAGRHGIIGTDGQLYHPVAPSGPGPVEWEQA
jgi:hypothetical protein